MEIKKNILIEDLVDNFPFAVNYLSKNGIRCIRCGEPIWGTLEDAAKEKDFSDEEVDNFVNELNNLNYEFENAVSENVKKYRYK